MNFRHVSLVIAESVDAWRIIPRVVLVLYSTLVFNLYLWYRSIPTYIQEQCDSSVLKVLIDSGGLTIDEARSIACSVVDIVGGPTMAQSAFVTTIIGLSTGIFGLYVATGRKWDRGFNENPFDNRFNQFDGNNNYGPSYGPSPYIPPRPPYNDRGGDNRWGQSYGPWGGQNDMVDHNRDGT